MRAIKFRAWDKKRKTMPYSDDGNQEYGWFTDNDGGMICVRIEEKRDVKLNNIMQYTGLKDKNDKEIYEGDILYKHDEEFGDIYMTVCFDAGAFTVQEKDYESEYILLGDENKDYEIIGNIYDNPDLT